ncbi:MAG: M50 family metallopeptidase [Parcubacteria group bacterium]|nr:M50 family metallopeptidase [Parcubacteria group bacterium]
MKNIILGLLATMMFLLPTSLVHEFGRYLTLKMFRVPIKEFGFGSGPLLYQRKKSITRSIRMFPFMAYVDFDETNNFYLNLARWKKIIIFFAGIIGNLSLAFILIIPIWLNHVKFDIALYQIILACNTRLGIGPISFIKIIIRTISYGFIPTMLFLGIFSLLAGIANLFPLPGFDGGWILTTLLKIPETKYSPITKKSIKIINFIVFIICLVDIILLL